MSLHPDAVEINDLFLSAYAIYHGYPMMKCSDRNGGCWTLLIPVCDLDILRSEIEDKDASICVKAYIDAVKRARHLVGLAKQNFGEWLSPEWRALIYKR
jgi:hypothetical protein